MERNTEIFNLEESSTFTFTVTIINMTYKFVFMFFLLCKLYRPQNTITQKLITQICYSYKTCLHLSSRNFMFS
jgi:hypothetical protein